MDGMGLGYTSLGADIQLTLVISNTDNSNYCLSNKIFDKIGLVLLYAFYISTPSISKILVPWSLR